MARDCDLVSYIGRYESEDPLLRLSSSLLLRLHLHQNHQSSPQTVRILCVNSTDNASCLHFQSLSSSISNCVKRALFSSYSSEASPCAAFLRPLNAVSSSSTSFAISSFRDPIGASRKIRSHRGLRSEAQNSSKF